MEAEGIDAVLRDAGTLLATLRTVPSGAGDDALTEAFFGVDPA